MNLMKTYKGDTVPTATKYVFSFASIGRDAAYVLVSLFLMLYLQFTLKSTSPGQYKSMMTVIIVIMVITRLWDGINDPMIGMLIENSRFKMGKYKPWILVGAITNSIMLFLMFSVRLPGWWFVAGFAVFYLLWEITFTLNDIAYWSMMPSLTPDQKQRNQLTMLMSIGINIGAFTVGGIVPMLYPGNAINAFRNIALVISIVFLVSQLLVVFVCKERDRSEVDKETPIKFKDLFGVIFNNKQLLVMLVVITVYYLGSEMFNNLGQTYMQFVYGYGDAAQPIFMFLIAYAGGSLLANFSFGFLLKKYSRQQLLKASYIISSIGNGLLFLLGVIHAFKLYELIGIVAIPREVLMTLFTVLALIIFSPTALFYMILLVQVTNTIEYNEWTTGERKESVVFSARPFAAKLASSLTTLVGFLVLFSGNVYDITQKISDAEVRGVEELTGQEVLDLAQAAINSANLPRALTSLIVGMTVIPFICNTTAYLLISRKYKIDEETYTRMLVDIKAGNVGPQNAF